MDLKVRFIGICELAGAVGLILPALTNVMPVLTTWAAVATQLGFAPIELGRLDQGGVPLHQDLSPSTSDPS
jgi:DoxX-like family